MSTLCVHNKGHSRERICVLHLITSLEVGGAELMLLKLSSRMNPDRFVNHVICLGEDGPVGQRISAHGIPVHTLNMPRGWVTIQGLIRLNKLMRQINPDILQTWMYHADLLGALFSKWSRSAPVCWNIRCSNMDFAKYRPATRIAVKLCAVLSAIPDVIVANSMNGESHHKRMGYRSKRWEVIPNGFDLRKFKPDGKAREGLVQELGLDGKRPFALIGYIARFDPMKDHSTFLKAASRLLGERDDVHFILAGRNIEWGNREIFERVPAAFSLNFHFLGERDDVERITAALDIACSVSSGEGFSNVIGEAMACEVPCVVTDVGDSALIIGDTGEVIRPRDSDALLRAWKKILNLSGDERSELGKAARKRVRDCFDILKIVERYEDLYTSLMDEHRTGSRRRLNPPTRRDSLPGL
jgi:glycosyltransferase involved in cell wall biosynthesis